jgi:hypothetical protein
VLLTWLNMLTRLGEAIANTVMTNIATTAKAICTHPRINPAVAMLLPLMVPLLSLISFFAIEPVMTAAMAFKKMGRMVQAVMPQTRLAIASPLVLGWIIGVGLSESALKSDILPSLVNNLVQIIHLFRDFYPH